VEAGRVRFGRLGGRKERQSGLGFLFQRGKKGMDIYGGSSPKDMRAVQEAQGGGEKG